MREKAHQLCRDFLRGAWEDITPEELILKPITGGLTNILYYCALPNSHKSKSKEPREIVLRIYGQTESEECVQATLTDSVIFSILSERELGPRLFGMFPGGRLEEFIPSRTMKVTEMRDPQYVQKIATNMAIFHSLDIPLTKEPTYVTNTMDKWVITYRDILKSGTLKCEGIDNSKLEKLKNFNFEKEISYVMELVSKASSDVVFSHNDLQEGNILINTVNNNNNDDNRISVIDFEYCSYNYRAYDLANHFCEYRYDYTPPEHPYFTPCKDKYPTREQQLSFIRSYTKASKSAKNLDLNEEQILKDIKVFVLVSDLFWGLWAIVQSQTSTIPFGYMEWALERIDDYHTDKERLNN